MPPGNEDQEGRLPAEGDGVHRSLRIVLHGHHADREDIRTAVQMLRSTGHDVDVRATWETGHARAFTSEVARTVDVVVAAGGDGTVSEVAEGLVGTEDASAALAVLPLGTANDFATAAGIPMDDVTAALLLAAHAGVVREVDVITVEGRVVLNLATAGPGTSATAETPEGLKRALGGLSYTLAGIAQIGSITAQEGSVRGPDFEWAGRFLVIAVGNGRQAGGGVTLCPGARIDDGLLDVRIIPEGEGAGALLVNGLLHGKEVALEEASMGYRAPWIEVTTSAALQVNIDGEPIGGTHFRFEVLSGALRAVLPRETPLLGG
jgi:lipid kinase YegS